MRSVWAFVFLLASSFAQEDARSLAERAKSLLARPDAKGAEALLRTAMAQDPTDAEVPLLLGLLLEHPLRDSAVELRAQVWPLYQKALSLREQDPSTSPSDLAFALELNARLLTRMQEPIASSQLTGRAQAIRQRLLEQMQTAEPHVGTAYEAGRDGTRPPVPKERKDPEYSEQGRVARHQGTVVVSTVVGLDGKPTRIQVLQGAGFGLDEKAVDTLSEWRFEPGHKDGQPVPTKIKVEFNFRLL